MGWIRGFVVCKDEVAEAVESALAAQSVSNRLVSRGGESAFAFAGRVFPEFDLGGVLVCTVDGRSSGYSHSRLTSYRPSRLIPKLGLTFGITLRASDADQSVHSSGLTAIWRRLGPESESGSADGLTAFRWDLDDCEIDDPQIPAQAQGLKAIQCWLEERNIPYRVVLFDQGYPGDFGDLPQIDDIFIGPATCLTLSWKTATGEPNSVTANDAEFMIDGDGVPDSELWTL